MRVLATKTINAYCECYPDAAEALRSWVALIGLRDYEHFVALKGGFNSVDLISDDRVVFNLKGNTTG